MPEHTCTRCGTPLAAPLDEYGDIRAPLCRSCFLDPAGVEDNLPELRQKLRDAQDDLQAKRREGDYREIERSKAEARVRELVDAIHRAEKAQSERRRAWANGLFKKVA